MQCLCTACIHRMQFKGLGVPNKHFATQNRRLYRQTHCLLPLWSLSECSRNLKIIFQARPSVSSSTWSGRLFFCAKIFEVVNRSKQCELVPTHNFWMPPYRKQSHLFWMFCSSTWRVERIGNISGRCNWEVRISFRNRQSGTLIEQ